MDYRFIQVHGYFGGYAHSITNYIVSMQTADIYFQGFVKSVVEILEVGLVKGIAARLRYGIY